MYFPRGIIKVAVRIRARAINYGSPKSRIIYNDHLARAQIDMKPHPRYGNVSGLTKSKTGEQSDAFGGTTVYVCIQRDRATYHFNIKNESYNFDKRRSKCNRTERNTPALTYREIMSPNRF